MKNELNSSSNARITPIFVIGAMKSGTASLFKYLKSQDEVCFPPIKEPEFFSIKMGDNKFKQGSFWDLYNIKQHHNFVFDGSTGYTKYPAEVNVPKRIFEYGLKPKFIYIVRNPFDRIESHYNYMRKDLDWNAKITSKHLINVSNYYLQLEQYKTFFSKQDFLILDFEVLRDNPYKILQQIKDFTGISDLLTQVNPLEKNHITQPVNRKELKIKKNIEGKVQFLPDSIKKIGKNILTKSFKKKKKKLTKKQKNIIYEELKSDMFKFKKEYDFPVEKWGFKS